MELLGRERCAGFYTQEVREQGRRVGFDVVTIDGARGPLARAGAPGPRVSRYGVDLPSFERLALPALQAAEPKRVLIIDEIGKMELFSARFAELAERALAAEARCPVLGTLMQGRHPLIDPLRRRPDIRVLTVTPGNREALPGRLAEVYREALRSPEGR